MHKATAVVLFALLTTPLHAVAEAAYPTILTERAKAGYQEYYLPGPRDKAFAITKDGQNFYYASKQKSAMRAARVVMYRCLLRFGEPCRLWKVNDDDILSSYDMAGKESNEVVANLPSDLPDYDYAFEKANRNVIVPKSLRDASQLHSPTPMEAPAGATTISTQKLLTLYKSEPGIVVIDALQFTDSPIKAALPKASWLFGAGLSQAKDNDNIESQLARVMKNLAPNKDSPIVTYCLDYECWLSWNAAMRLVAMGYKQVFWYRGGVEAWTAAKLPLVKTPLTAEVW